MSKVSRLDQRYVWHPFTQMRDWRRCEPLVIVEGRGAVLRDEQGREYLDANASIWTNLHGHNHPRLNAAVRQQLGRVAHVSALGLANEPAARLAERLVRAASGPSPRGRRARRDPGGGEVGPRLEQVFYSDNGSTAIEVALKMAYEFSRRTGRSRRPRFLSLEGAYHGDTVGAVSLGHIDLFHRAYSGLLFRTDTVMAPYCYRCPFNRAKPERADARTYRRCRWECVASVERHCEHQRRKGGAYAGFVFEPLIQGAAGMIPQPQGWLRRVSEIARGHGAQLIADEVLTGFGRTGAGASGTATGPSSGVSGRNRLFACQAESVQPDFLCLAKGLTGGYLPMAATLTSSAVAEVFLGEYEELKTFFHGHSYTGNPLGAAVALASLEVLDSVGSKRARVRLEKGMAERLARLWDLPHVGDIRQVGLMAGIELVRDWRTREPYDLGDRAGIRVCEVMARRGVLTRPVGNVVVLMPPYCVTDRQMDRMVGALEWAVREELGR